ncbi:amidoligase family protein [Palleronia caenipelagi]|uniref:Amidoligase enzyme n=1 Tax=Palleronia caenipelagi TaxID=2489174 RepID=A0A547Q5L8_9RHOB|nr:amidoligase family protein [Palleronia caenipelagi]TRD21681.1 hypothetical protein FEV53_08040 [Palleronia caenipelagi]
MTHIAHLPNPNTRDGAPRRVGIEVECGGLPEDDLARTLARRLGGEAREKAPYEWIVTGSELGEVEVLLDTALRKSVESDLEKSGLDLGRSVIPVEFVTEPILPEQIETLDSVCQDLIKDGAFGTNEGIALGYGVHLNVALASTELDAIQPTLTAFALMEDWMRDRMNIDASRRLLPFINPYSADLVDALCDRDTDWTLERLMDAYLEHAGSRNHGLDALPLFKSLDEDRVVSAVPEMADKGARPAWHYRLPDCRLGEEGWSIALEWNRWCAVETVAADTNLMAQLMDAWRDYRNRTVPVPGLWGKTSAEILDQAVTFR